MNTPDFHAAIDELAPRILHGQADDIERAELGRLLAQSPENRRRFLDHTALHSLLAQGAKAGAFADNKVEYFRRMAAMPVAKPRRFLKVWLPAAAAMVAVCLIAISLLSVTATAALDRVIAAMAKNQDRTYRIEVLEPGNPESLRDRDERGRFPASSHLDGATLWLRGPGQFVLRQTLPNGETRHLGSDGVASWSIRGADTAQVSDDPQHFGGGLMAKRREIAFLDLQDQLDELKQLYQIDWLDRSGTGLWKLRGTRKSADQGGAREIELWFDPGSALLQRMILRQLPRRNGGPRGISVALQSTEPLPPDFFKHTYPHAPSP
jgi:hypothetical protein